MADSDYQKPRSRHTMLHDWHRLLQETSAPCLAVYVCISDYAWGDKLEAWPAQTTIAEETNMSVRTVERAVKRLEEHGFIHITKQHGKDGRIHNHYYLIAKSAGAPPTESRPTPDTDDAPPPTAVAVEEGEGNQEKESNTGLSTFMDFWEVFGKKKDRSGALRVWMKLYTDAKLPENILEATAAYVGSTPDAQFRMEPRRWLLNERWLDELTTKSPDRPYSEQIKEIDEANRRRQDGWD